MFTKLLLLSTAVSAQNSQLISSTTRSLKDKNKEVAIINESTKAIPFASNFDEVTVDNISQTFLMHILDDRLTKGEKRSAYISIIKDEKNEAFAKLTIDDTSVFAKNKRNIFRTDLVQKFQTSEKIKACVTIRKEKMQTNTAALQLFFDEAKAFEVRLNNVTSVDSEGGSKGGNKLFFQFFSANKPVKGPNGKPAEIVAKYSTWYTACVISGSDNAVVIQFGAENTELTTAIAYKSEVPLVAKNVITEMHWGGLSYFEAVQERFNPDTIDLKNIVIEYPDLKKGKQ